ncbi:MAG: hypothetical protein H7Y27_15700, partial [Gemmatimonadaceae bacterium]|nr:hypothetical protein [Chitinophagaceae bacterium]
MKIFYTLGLSLLIFSFTKSTAQYSRHIIELKDKNNNLHDTKKPATFLSARAIERRTRYKIPIDIIDLPVTAAYLDSIRKVPNVIILNSSKWLNQVCIQTTDPAALAKINGFSFVKKAEAIAPAAAPGLPPVASLKFPKESGTVLGLPPVIAGVNGINVNYYDYGSSLGQVHI